MKIILSRKGFDNQYGGQPSPILPDRTLLSLPIPSKGESIMYSDLFHGDKSYLQIIKELKPKTKIKDSYTCHLDPDLRKNITKRSSDWVPLFGQTGGSQGHLINKGVGKGDLFLFFGTFRETELQDGSLKYTKKGPDLHIIYAYLQIGEIYNNLQINIPKLLHHPHANSRLLKEKNNCIYEPTEKLSFNESLSGSGNLKYNKDLVLTKEGLSKSKWSLPTFFKDISMSYHSEGSFSNDYFQSAPKGQEFVIENNNNVKEWAKNIITKGMSY